MKCSICKKNMKPAKGVIEQDGVEYDFFKCACGEELMDMAQLKIVADKYRRLRKAKEVTFAKWGNSIAVRIPSDIVAEFKIKSGKHGLLTKEKEGIKIVPA